MQICLSRSSLTQSRTQSFALAGIPTCFSCRMRHIKFDRDRDDLDRSYYGFFALERSEIVKLYRTMAALLNDSVAQQAADLILEAHFDNDSVDLEEFFPHGIEDDVWGAFLEVLRLPFFQEHDNKVFVREGHVLHAMHFAGLYTDMSQVPAGVEVFALTELGESLIEQNGVGNFAEHTLATMECNDAQVHEA